MPRFCVDFLDVLLDLLRDELGDDATVMSRIPDHIDQYVPLVTVRRTGGDSLAPEFYDTPLVNVQCWCVEDRDNGIDQYRAAADLADRVRGILWTAYRTQQVIPGQGWIGSIRESGGPVEISDPDAPSFGRVTATYEIRVRPAA